LKLIVAVLVGWGTDLRDSLRTGRSEEKDDGDYEEKDDDDDGDYEEKDDDDDDDDDDNDDDDDDDNDDGDDDDDDDDDGDGHGSETDTDPTTTLLIQVEDADKALFKVSNYFESVQAIGHSAVRSIIGRFDYDTLTAERNQVSRQCPS
jgi:hypothetical protein